MTDTLYDTIIKTVVIQTDSIYSSADVLSRLDSFYSHSISLITTYLAIIAPVVLGLISIGGILIQKHNYKLEKESINKDIEKLNKLLQYHKDEIDKKFNIVKDVMEKTIKNNYGTVINHLSETNYDPFHIGNLYEISISYAKGDFSSIYSTILSSLEIFNKRDYLGIYCSRFLETLLDCLNSNHEDLSKGKVEDFIQIVDSIIIKASKDVDFEFNKFIINYAQKVIEKLKEILPNKQYEGVEFLARAATNWKMGESNQEGK